MMIAMIKPLVSGGEKEAQEQTRGYSLHLEEAEESDIGTGALDSVKSVALASFR